MARAISDAKRADIVADLRRGELTHRQVADKHNVSPRSVDKISAEKRRAPKGDPLLDRLDKLAATAERALELAEQSSDARELSTALRAAHAALIAVEKLRADIVRQDGDGTRGQVDAFKKILIEELRDHPEVRQRVAERLLAATKDGSA